MADIGTGDLIHDCSAFNARVAKVEPFYRRVGRGFVLADIDITNDKGGSCSFTHCGVEPGWTRENILRYWAENLKFWQASGDTWNFAKRYEFTTVLEDGRAEVDYAGLKAKYSI
jgi:hypothetical protein